MSNNASKHAAIPAAAVIAIATLSIPQSASAEQEGLEVVATSKGEAGSGLENSSLEVHTPQRSKGSDYVSISWTVKAQGGVFKSGQIQSKTYKYFQAGVTGVTATDEKSKIRYYPLQDTRKVCLCSGIHKPRGYILNVESGNLSTFWNSYMISQDVKTVTLDVPGFKPAEDIPIS
ncbi:hypothetical protein GCM10009799_32800 [Nocardiopsis rhodophaea]|uniref:Uncharacterized protein n=1 Tax=Nocardiopsis rhodophaea TaxID=280238 RepID=A0ABN2TAM9_9ACTN